MDHDDELHDRPPRRRVDEQSLEQRQQMIRHALLNDQQFLSQIDGDLPHARDHLVIMSDEQRHGLASVSEREQRHKYRDRTISRSWLVIAAVGGFLLLAITAAASVIAALHTGR